MKRILTALVFLVSMACTKEAPRILQGERLVEGRVQGLYRSPDGRAVATLAEVQKVASPGAPRDLVAGALNVSLDGGKARRLGGGVTNLPDALAFSPDGSFIAFLAGYSVPRAHGELRLARLSGGEPEVVAENVTFYAFSTDSKQLAWVTGGSLYLRPVEGGEPRLITEGVATVAFGPQNTTAQHTMLIRRSMKAGGALLSYDLVTAKLEAIARGARMMVFSESGNAAFQAEELLEAKDVAPETVLGRKKAVGESRAGLYLYAKGVVLPVSEEGATEFHFSPDGSRLAFLTPPKLGQTAGELWVYDGSSTRRVASRVQSVAFAADGSLLLLGAWEANSAAGTLGVEPKGGKLREIARNVKQFRLSPKGGYVLFSQLVPVQGVYTLALVVHPVHAPEDLKPRTVQVGVYGFTVDEEETMLAYKSLCLEDGKACSLFVTGIEEGAEPRKLADRVAAFEFVPGQKELAIVISRHTERHDPTLIYTLGLAPVGGGELRLLDDHMTGEFIHTGDRLAWIVSEAGRAGLYTAPFDQALTPTEAMKRKK